MTEKCRPPRWVFIIIYTKLSFTSGEEEEGYWEKVLDSKGSKKGRKKPGRGGKRRKGRVEGEHGRVVLMMQEEGGKGDRRAKKAYLLPNTPRPRRIINKKCLILSFVSVMIASAHM